VFLKDSERREKIPPPKPAALLCEQAHSHLRVILNKEPTSVEENKYIHM